VAGRPADARVAGRPADTRVAVRSWPDD